MNKGNEDRYLEALRLNREGKTCKQIGELYGVSYVRGWQLVQKGKEIEQKRQAEEV